MKLEFSRQKRRYRGIMVCGKCSMEFSDAEIKDGYYFCKVEKTAFH